MVAFAAVRRNGIVALQCAIVGIVLAAAALYPPATGRLLLVPLMPGSDHHMLASAVNAGASLVGPGPLPHSFVVSGKRDAIAASLEGVMIVAAPPAGCGKRLA
jgi:hypothetical protein